MRLRRHAGQRRQRAVERAWADLPLRAKGLVVIAIPLACFVVAAALFTVTLAQDRQAQARVLHTVEVERQVSQLRILLQSGVTGYVLTGQERYLASYDANARSVPAALARLRELVSDNPGQRRRLQQVGVLADRRQRLLAELVASVRADSPQQRRLARLPARGGPAAADRGGRRRARDRRRLAGAAVRPLRAAGGRPRRGGGLRAGPAVVQAAGRGDGGALGLSSTPQQGCTFWVELPLTEAPAMRAARDGDGQDGAAAAERVREPGQEQPPTELTVLYIEDNLSNLISRLLDEGARAFLTKPLDVKELLALVDAVAAERRQAAATRSP